MLTPIHKIADTLEKLGVLTTKNHKNFVVINSPYVLWLGISAKGPPEISLRPNAGGEEGAISKIAPDNKKSWPVTNLAVTNTTFGNKIQALAEGAGQYLPECELLENAREIALILKENPDISGKINAGIKATIEAMEERYKTLQLKEKSKEEKRTNTKELKFLKDFLFGKTYKLPLIIGTPEKCNLLLSGMLTEQASRLLMQTSPEGERLQTYPFQTGTESIRLRGLPIMPMPYYPVSRPKDYPALFGYARRGSFLPLAEEFQDKIRTTIQYLTSKPELHRRIQHQGKPLLLLAAPSNDATFTEAGLLLETLQPQNIRELKQNRLKFETACKENKGEVSIVILKANFTLNIKPVFDATLSLQSWQELENNWADRQTLAGYYIYPATFPNTEVPLLDLDKVLHNQFRAPNRKVECKTIPGESENRAVRNLIHAADSAENAAYEENIWFKNETGKAKWPETLSVEPAFPEKTTPPVPPAVYQIFETLGHDTYEYECPCACTPNGCMGHGTNIPISISFQNATFMVAGYDAGDFPNREESNYICDIVERIETAGRIFQPALELIRDMLVDQETLAAEIRNEALCERARKILTEAEFPI